MAIPDGATLPQPFARTICTIRSSWPTWSARSRGSSGDRAHERIAIHGDYDVDGITSTVILRRALEMLGGDVVHFIPERLRDGYGLQPAAIERLHAEACGSSCRSTAAFAASKRRAARASSASI